MYAFPKAGCGTACIISAQCDFERVLKAICSCVVTQSASLWLNMWIQKDNGPFFTGYRQTIIQGNKNIASWMYFELKNAIVVKYIGSTWRNVVKQNNPYCGTAITAP